MCMADRRSVLQRRGLGGSCVATTLSVKLEMLSAVILFTENRSFDF